MNTIARFEAALLNNFRAAEFSRKAPVQVCFERDARTHTWRVALRRLNAFSLHHRHPQVPQKLFFDRQKNVYVRCRPDLENAPPETRQDIARALRACGTKNTDLPAMFYKKISPQDAGIFVEQAAQLLARRWDACVASGLMPL